ncbi:MAG: glycoside hydrolase family 31 protein [Candidatus Bathyarchaeia archaeon]
MSGVASYVKRKKSREVLFNLKPSGRLRLQICGANVIRVTYSPNELPPEDESLSIIKRLLRSVDWRLEEGADEISLVTNKVTLLVNFKSGLLEFRDASGRSLLKECSRNMIPANVAGEKTYHAEEVFSVSDNECFYGLGQHPGLFNYRGRSITLIQKNWDVAIPFLISSRGYGVLWDNYSMCRFDSFRNDGGDKISLWFEVADAIDYYFIYGPSIDSIIASYRELTGSAPLLPIWAYGYWQSKERYKTQDEIVKTAKTFRERGIPIDIIVQDWMYWGKHGWNAFKFDEESFPDPPKMVSDLHALNLHVLISIWPIFDVNTDVYKDMFSRGYICPNTRCYDPFNEGARKLYWDYIRKAFFDIGFDGWWLDATEPETGAGWSSFYSPFHSTKTAMGSGARVLNAYSLMTTRAVYEGQRSASNKRVLILTRSSFIGQQRYSTVTWSGDILHDWGALREQIPAGLNFSISGIPYWTTDIGGFFSGNPETESYREIFVRWFQWGAFCPIFRVHGTTYAKEPWMFGSEIENILVKYIKLRYRLLPYIYSVAWKVTSEGYTMMRPLIMDFREDPMALNIEDQYMFGPAFMVSPVTLPGVPGRRVYLPKTPGGWYDFWTGKRTDGGQVINAPTPLDVMPIHVKAGSIVPMGPILQYAKEKPADPMEIRIYPGADGVFTIYEDDGETYEYERGKYSLIHLEWRDEEKTLSIEKRTGKYPGMLKERTFNIVLVKENHGVGLEEAEPDQTVLYKGKKMLIKL